MFVSATAAAACEVVFLASRAAGGPQAVMPTTPASSSAAATEDRMFMMVVPPVFPRPVSPGALGAGSFSGLHHQAAAPGPPAASGNPLAVSRRSLAGRAPAGARSSGAETHKGPRT